VAEAAGPSSPYGLSPFCFIFVEVRKKLEKMRKKEKKKEKKMRKRWKKKEKKMRKK
jgi:hypothetical protein